MDSSPSHEGIFELQLMTVYCVAHVNLITSKVIFIPPNSDELVAFSGKNALPRDLHRRLCFPSVNWSVILLLIC